VSSRLIDALVQAHEILESSGIAHALIGGIAANLYRRRPRATQDVDFAIEATPAEVVRVIEAFREAGWDAKVRNGKHETLRLAHADLPRVDILIAGTDFEESAIRRAVRLTIDGRELTIVTPEDLIVYKLIAGRGHDYEAVGAILHALPSIDEGYVCGWLDQFGMADRWQAAVEEAQRIDEE
jgi:predicted nucleotidyltransferase